MGGALRRRHVQCSCSSAARATFGVSSQHKKHTTRVVALSVSFRISTLQLLLCACAGTCVGHNVIKPIHGRPCEPSKRFTASANSRATVEPRADHFFQLRMTSWKGGTRVGDSALTTPSLVHQHDAVVRRVKEAPAPTFAAPRHHFPRLSLCLLHTPRGVPPSAPMLDHATP